MRSKMEIVEFYLRGLEDYQLLLSDKDNIQKGILHVKDLAPFIKEISNLINVYRWKKSGQNLLNEIIEDINDHILKNVPKFKDIKHENGIEIKPIKEKENAIT